MGIFYINEAYNAYYVLFRNKDQKEFEYMYIEQKYMPAIVEYNNIMLGKQKRFSSDLYVDEKIASAIIDYSFKYYMHWSPENVMHRLNKQISQNLNIDGLLNKFFPIPYELNKNKDYFYYACALYPDKCQYDIRSSVLSVYRNVVAGKKKTFTKNFFNDEHAIDRAIICMQDALSKMRFSSVKDIYERFSAPNADAILESIKLKVPCKMYYESPLDYVNDALPENMRSDFWYHYYKFKSNY